MKIHHSMELQKVNQKEILKSWSENFNKANLSGILNLYNPSSILIPTFSPDILSCRSEIKEYFTKLIEGQNSSVEIQLDSILEQEITESIFLLSGNYIFKLEKNKKIHARFSFIIDITSVNPIKHHHSSPITKPD